MKVNKNIWTGKNKPYNRNSLYFPNGVNQDGGSAGGSGESGGSDVEYLDLSGLNEENFGVVNISSLLKIKNAGKIGIGQTGLLINDFDEVLAGAFAKELRMWIGDSMVTSIKDLLPLMGLSIDYDAIPRLTKEQFYDLNA